MTYYSYRIMLNRWLVLCDIRDEHGDPVHLTPHQWRHTFASRLKVRGIASDASFDGFGDRDLVRDLGFRGLRAAG
jgi:integrase